MSKKHRTPAPEATPDAGGFVPSDDAEPINPVVEDGDADGESAASPDDDSPFIERAPAAAATPAPAETFRMKQGGWVARQFPLNTNGLLTRSMCRTRGLNPDLLVKQGELVPVAT